MRRFLALCLLAAGPAWGGAWPRPPGEVFLSLRFDRDQPAQGEASNSVSAYGEYGLSARWTLIGQFSNSTQPWTPSRAAIGLNFALSAPDATNRWAVGFGVSTPPDVMGAMMEARGEVSLHWGRGFESRWGGGWLGMESSLEYRTPGSDTIFKADFTAGLKPTDNWMLIAQLQTGIYPEAPVVRLAPSVVRRLGPRLHMQVGALVGLTGDDGIGVKASFWYGN